ncbi:hypothetical protein C2869_18730 [Saccharobesus litoralis]|uniref:Uncharacterized protein n=1 Tax=Saccharobesus litoralis TaxID=2172099 RepID=A0A2S0VVS0_9ALTE|nr:hypothetical protein [Saccharobesus litoralis]AWB68317.1 hypothetical protein C2869_18730 [Saccharobesus litoralis]
MVLSVHEKLTVIYRLEPGCLGPTGKDHIEDFCQYANKSLRSIDSECVNWAIIPRYDKSLPELEYQIQRKKLDKAKAEQFIDVFKKDLDSLEEHMHEQLSLLIDNFLQR